MKTAIAIVAQSLGLPIPQNMSVAAHIGLPVTSEDDIDVAEE